MSLFKTVGRDSIVYLASRIIPAILGYFTIYFLIKLYGATTYGKFSYILSTSTMLASFSIGWLNQSFLRFNNSLQSRIYYKNAVVVCVIIALIFLIIGSLFFYSELRVLELILLSLSIIIYLFIRTEKQSNFKKTEIVKMEFFKSTAYFLLPIVFCYLFNNQNHTYIVSGLTLANFTMLFFLPKGIFKNLKTFFLDKNTKLQVIRMMKFGMPLSLWLAVMQSTNFIDRYFINKNLGEVGLGVYASSADLLSKMYSFFIFPITLALHPILVKHWKKDKEEAKKTITKILLLMTAVFVVYFAAIIVFQKQILENITGRYVLESNFIVLVALAHYLWQIALIVQKPLEMNYKTLDMLFILSGCVALHPILIYLFIDDYGLIAVSSSLAISGLIYNFVIFTYSKISN